MIRPKTRLDMLDLFPRNGVVAELGVFRGQFSRQLLSRLNPSRLYLVDLWQQPTDWLIDGMLQRVSGIAAHQHVCDSLESDQRVIVRRQSTLEFLASMPDQSLDVVYLDADHSYRSVRDEIALAWPRLRPGGWLAGHDYCDLFPGVIRSVAELCDLRKVPITALTDDTPGPVINCPNGPATMAYNSFAIQVPT